MTVASTTSKASYNGDGVTVTFAVPFYFLANTDLLATLRAADGTESNPSVASYTGAGNPAGGSITMTAAPATGTRLVITRAAPLTQSLSLPTNTIFPAASVEQELDKLTMITQELQEQLNRCIKLAITSNSTGPTSPEPSASALIGWNAAGTNLQNYTPASLNLLTCFYQQDISHVSFNNGSAVSAGVNFDLNGVLGLPAGTAAAPSLTNRADIDTGLYFPAANTLGLAAFAALALSITNPASAVDYLQLSGAATALLPYVSLEAKGTDAVVGIDYKTKGTTTSGSQFNGQVTETTGRHRFYINGAPVLQLTDTYWNPNTLYQGAPTAWVTISSGALAGGPDNIAMISCESSIYPATATGVTLALGGKGPSGAIHFCNNGYMGHVSIGALANPVANDAYDVPNILWLKGSVAGSGNDAVIFTNYAEGDSTIGMTFYNQGSGGFTFKTQNAACTVLELKDAVAGTNFLRVTPGASAAPTLEARGADADVSIKYLSKAAGTHDFYAQSTLAFRVTGAASGVNRISVSGSATGNDPTISAQGTDAAVGLKIYTAGTGNLTFYTQNTNATHLKILHTATAVDYVTITGGATGAPGTVTIGADGTDGNVNINMTPKGTGLLKYAGNEVATKANNLGVFAATTSLQLLGVISDETGSGSLVFATSPVLVTPTLGDATASSLTLTGSTKPAIGAYTSAANTLDLTARSLQVLSLTNPATAVNYFTMQGSATTAQLQLNATGTDTDIGIRYQGKGTGTHDFYANSSLTLRISAAASTVNRITISGAATGSNPSISAQAGDAAVGLKIYTAGTGNIDFQSDNTSTTLFQMLRTASSVNWLTSTPGATGTGPTLSAAGETNVDLILAAKGTGLLKMGTAAMTVANGSVACTMTSLGPTGSHTTIQKWLSIKDSAGTVLYIPCY